MNNMDQCYVPPVNRLADDVRPAMDILKAARINNRHLLEATICQLQDGELTRCLADPNSGDVLAYVADCEDDQIPADLIALSRWAQTQGFDWVYIGDDEDEVEGLSLFTW